MVGIRLPKGASVGPTVNCSQSSGAGGLKRVTFPFGSMTATTYLKSCQMTADSSQPWRVWDYIFGPEDPRQADDDG
jgi:hypothetical protein